MHACVYVCMCVCDTPKVEPSGDVSASLVVPLVKLVVESVDQ